MSMSPMHILLTFALTVQAKKITITSASQVPLVLTCLLEICCSALSVTTTHHWFLSDIVRETAELALKVYEYLFFTCTITGVTTSRALARTCTSIAALAITWGFESIAATCWTRLLLYRIEHGPDDEWTKAERAMTAALRSAQFSPPNYADFKTLLRALQAAEWDESSSSLQVRI